MGRVDSMSDTRDEMIEEGGGKSNQRTGTGEEEG